MLDPAAELDRDGCATIERLVSPTLTAAIAEQVEPLFGDADQRRPGIRRVIEKTPALIPLLAQSPLNALIRRLCGESASIVRSLLFDKSKDSNWLVPWHQDATIALADQAQVPGFGPWSVKQGEHHCRPPRWLIDQVAVIRLHLDPCTAASGPLRVIPGSHLHGLVSDARVDEIARAGPERECCVEAGGVVIMRPHTIHASSKATAPVRRRVLHLECTAAALPDGLSWGECTRLPPDADSYASAIDGSAP